MKAIFYIAQNTFKETIRNKILYNILLVAGVALVLSVSFGDLSLFSRGQVMADFGLATMSLTGLLLAVFIGVGMLGVEISSKTIYGVVTKPVTREFFILGKFFGLLATLLLNFSLIAVVFFVTIKVMGANQNLSIIYAILLLMVEMIVIVAAAIFFSAFTTPTLAAIFTLGFYVAGHLNDMVGIGAQQQNDIVWKFVLKTFSYILPNLEHFNIRTAIVYNLPIPSGFVSGAVIYGLCYAAILLVMSVALFSRKDL
jgi:ABC-type transport system involved in multi-copper enzyme maturation permease subunit